MPHDGHHHHADHGSGGGGDAVDPVCGMSVVKATAIERGLHHEHGGTDHYFCAKGCRLDFIDDPERYLRPDHVPSM